MDSLKVAGLRGPALNVYTVLVVKPDGMTEDQLSRHTGFEKRAVSRGAALLESLGVAELIGGGRWTLSAAARTELDTVRSSESQKRESVTRVGAYDARVGASLSSSFFSTIDPQAIDSITQEEEEDARSRADVFLLLKAAGVGVNSPTMSRLLNLNLSPDYVRAHVDARQAKLERGDDVPVSHLIRSLLDGDPAPVVVDRQARREALYDAYGVKR